MLWAINKGMMGRKMEVALPIWQQQAATGIHRVSQSGFCSINSTISVKQQNHEDIHL
jgi:hypothetical protein